MFQQFKVLSMTVVASIQAVKLLSSMANAQRLCREATTTEELLAAATKFASSDVIADKFSDKNKALDAYMHKKTVGQLAEIEINNKVLREELEKQISNGKIPKERANEAKAGLLEIEKSLKDGNEMLKASQAKDTFLTDALSAAKWANRFMAAYCHDAATSPGEYSEALVAFSRKVWTDFEALKPSVLQEATKKSRLSYEGMFFMACASAAPAAIKIIAEQEFRMGNLENAEEYVNKAKRCANDINRLIRFSTDADDSVAEKLAKASMPAQSEIAQIYFLAGREEDARFELRKGLSDSGEEAARRELGLASEGRAFASGLVKGFASWASKELGLENSKPKIN